MAVTTRRSKLSWTCGASRTRAFFVSTAAVLLLLTTGALEAAELGELAHYDMVASLKPADHGLAVQMAIDLPPEHAGATVEFLLTSKLDITKSDPKVKKLGPAGDEGFQGINGSSVDLSERAEVTRYQVTFPADSTHLELTYRGPIQFALESQEEEYARGFRVTPGALDPEGIYLAGSTLWYPYFSDDLVTFKLSARTPEGWHLISQGDGTSRNADGIATWDSAGPVDEIILVGGPLKRYSEPAGAVMAEAYLHEADDADALARKYLDATAQYIEMYRKLVGPYPYKKFALVENFWETGYGMPSFTLLGPQIIRFPFILTSSYPHEILHNWWGNSVFVDYKTGNWCEGLTAYMADHLIKEQQGQGAQYRRDTMKKFRDFVKEERDFPLTEFRSRHSAATEAVGYGKTLMGFHMLRMRVGDDDFRKTLQKFYRDNRNRKATFGDVQAAFEETTGQNFDRFFREWVTLTGAARLELADVKVSKGGKGYVVSGRLLQKQPQGPFELAVPMAVTTTNGTALQTIPTGDADVRFEISTRNRPVLLSVDPEFDVFRMLDARETAPSIGQIFGEPAITAVLPSAADETEQAAYRKMVGAWEGATQSIDFVKDDEIDSLPADRAVWLLGRNNRFAPEVFDSNPVAQIELGQDAVGFPGSKVSFAGHSMVVVARNPANVAKAVGWITVDPEAAFDGVQRKLPHYGKYSYLAFEGDEPANVVKGEWSATDSPMRIDLRPADRRSQPLPAVELPRRAPLAELPPLFSAQRMVETIQWLANPEREGRGLGSDELEQTAEYIADQFAQIGLKPAGDNGGFYQTFTVQTGPDGGPHDLHNIVGYIPGSNPKFADQAVVISAHYDHLGHGWPDQRAQAEPGAVYPGADDNASGVAVLLELARAYANGPPPPRSLVFLALSGEEAGLLGSQYYVEHPTPVPLNGIIGVVNMDTVGRLGEHPVSVLGTESATEWPHVFRGVGFTTGINIAVIPGAAASSDQQSFINKGVPGVQIFSGSNLDYHRPSDTPDKIDPAGLVKIATVVKEAVTYLAEREEPLTVTGAGRKTGVIEQTRKSAAGNRRRVSTGTVPDMAYQGAGVRVDMVVPGSPADKAGLQAGDVITSIDGAEVADLAAFSELLKGFAPGDHMKVVAQRDGKPVELELELVAR